jgi:hypothetical protein
LYLIILHPDNKNYRRLRLNMLGDEVQAMLDCRKRALDQKSSSSVLLPMPCDEEENESKQSSKGFSFLEDS